MNVCLSSCNNVVRVHSHRIDCRVSMHAIAILVQLPVQSAQAPKNCITMLEHQALDQARIILRAPTRHRVEILRSVCRKVVYPSPGGVAQLVERVLYHSTRRAVPERSWVQSLLPTTEVEPGFSTFGGMLVTVLQLISPVCKTGTSLCLSEGCVLARHGVDLMICPGLLYSRRWSSQIINR
jgi:hypothetical protein